jgi:hypothetical protein
MATHGERVEAIVGALINGNPSNALKQRFAEAFVDYNLGGPPQSRGGPAPVTHDSTNLEKNQHMIKCVRQFMKRQLDQYESSTAVTAAAQAVQAQNDVDLTEQP